MPFVRFAATLFSAWIACVSVVSADSAMPETHVPGSWTLPPITAVHRARPWLVNYFHQAADESRVDHLSERLAQWDVVILSPALAHQMNISLATMRRVNPAIRILAWVPLQSPADPNLRAMLPPHAMERWTCKTADGKTFICPWGAPLYNPYAADFAWPKAVIRYIQKFVLTPGNYDGVMLDCLTENAFGSPVDIDGDGQSQTPADYRAWTEGMCYLLQHLREQYPQAIITGNGGNPWALSSPYLQWANGCMDENALGNEWNDKTWPFVNDPIEPILQRVLRREKLYFVQADVRRNRTQQECSMLEELTSEDQRRFRLALCTTLLHDNAYFGFDRGDCLHGQLWWFDEYNIDLGQPTALAAQDQPAPGLISRAYQNGLVVVNSTAEPATLNLQDPATDVSSKITGTRFTIAPQDGCMLSWPRRR